MSQLKLEQLRAFLTVVRAGSINKAAKILHLTQPAVTSRIKGLEDTLGAALFERTGSGVRLTKHGDLLVGYAEQFQQLAELVEKNVMDPGEVDGLLRLGVSETIAQSWLAEFVSELHRLHTRLRIEISVDISANLRESLLNRELDLAILLGPISEYTVDNVELPAFDLAWYRAATGGQGAIDFTRTPVITYAKSTRPYREIKSELFERFGPRATVFPSSSLASCFRLVEAGIGVAALPQALGARLVKEDRIREFDPGWHPNPLKFTASFLAEPKSHLIETAALLAREVALCDI